ncbi:MAG: hypothetical protein EBR30_02355 [Cytophagia bacterium]|nr:hypothetical protein [Cytophagia bacterium]
MKKFIHWLTELTKDERGNISVKPVIAVGGALTLCITMLASALTHKEVDPSDSLVDAVVIITAIGMGADTLDKFSLRSKTKASKPAPTPEPE